MRDCKKATNSESLLAKPSVLRAISDSAISGMISEKRPTENGRIVTRYAERATVRSRRLENLN